MDNYYHPRRIDSSADLLTEIQCDLEELRAWRLYQPRFLTYSQIYTRVMSSLIYRATEMGLTFLDDWTPVFNAEPLMEIVRRVDSVNAIRASKPAREVRRVQ
jgi:hypothetical protein